MNRRGFLKALLAGAAAVAAPAIAFGGGVAKKVKGPFRFAISDVDYQEFSIADMWAREAAKQLARQIDRSVFQSMLDDIESGLIEAEGEIIRVSPPIRIKPYV